jgi:hypothetical protein
MAGITLATAQTHLDTWIAADVAVASGQAYTINGTQMTKANAAEIRKNIEYWNDWVVRLSPSTGSRLRQVVPR